MNYNQILPVDEFKIQASILLKSLKSNTLTEQAENIQRFKNLPELSSLSLSEIIKNKDNIKLKHALKVIALENDFPSWKSLKDSLENDKKNFVDKEKHSVQKNQNLLEEFNRQVNNLLVKGYPNLLGLSEEKFLTEINTLKNQLNKINDLNNLPVVNHLPFVIVVQSSLILAEQAMSFVDFKGKQGFTVLEKEDIKKFKNIENLNTPETMIYLLLDIDTGKDLLNVTPNDALKIITKQGRSPLTIWEGIALVTQYPEILRTNNCFSLLGSRCGDRRVTALWISERKPKLGWCWAGNPHTWLGSASCKSRFC